MNRINKRLIVLDRLDDRRPILDVKYSIDIEKQNNQVYDVSGEINEIIGYRNRKYNDLETLHILEFTANWELETILRFYGEDYKNSGEKDSYYQTDFNGTQIMSVALAIPSYLAVKEIPSTGTYMDETDVKRVMTNEIWNKLEFIEFENKEEN